MTLYAVPDRAAILAERREAECAEMLEHLPAGHGVSSCLADRTLESWEDGRIVGDGITADLHTVLECHLIDALGLRRCEGCAFWVGASERVGSEFDGWWCRGCGA